MSSPIQEEGPGLPDATLSEWDRFSIMFFILIISCMGTVYWLFVRDPFAPIVCVLASIALYRYGIDKPYNLSKSLEPMRFPLREGVTVLIVFLDWALLLSLLAGNDICLSIIGSLLFGFVLPCSFLVLYIGYPRESLGFRKPKEGTGWLTFVICTVLLVPSFIQLLLSPAFPSLSFNKLALFVSQVLYLALAVGFVEELVFRGILQNRVVFYVRSRTLGILTTSSLFAVLHAFSALSGSGITYSTVGMAILYAFMTRFPLGVILGLVWNESESLLWVSLIHATNNAAVLLRLLAGT